MSFNQYTNRTKRRKSDAEQTKISTYFNKTSKNVETVDSNTEKDTSETAPTSDTCTATTDKEIMDITSTISNENTINERNVMVVDESSENITKENEQIENINIDSSGVTSIDMSQKPKHVKPKRGNSSGHQERWLSLLEGLKYIPGEGYYCTTCQQYSHSKQKEI